MLGGRLLTQLGNLILGDHHNLALSFDETSNGLP